jgi:hypothetical protein
MCEIHVKANTTATSNTSAYTMTHLPDRKCDPTAKGDVASILLRRREFRVSKELYATLANSAFGTTNREHAIQADHKLAE